MIFGIGRYSNALRILVCVVLAGLLALAVQIPPFSLRRLLIGVGVFTGPELAFLEIAVGTINALIVTLICLLVLRGPILWLTTASVVVQIVGIEWAYGFRQGGETVTDSLLRYTEHVGVILGGAIALWIHRTLIRPRSSVSAVK